MTDFSTDYYAILGVERDVEPRALRTAFLRLVKEHPPESSSEMFRLVSEAYRILSNPEKRRHYDTVERLPAELENRLRKAGLQARRDPDGAEDALRAICRDYPDLTAPRFTLGVMLERKGRSEEAAAIFDLLFVDDPNNSMYAKWLGESLLKTGREELGLSHLKQAIVLDKDDHECYLCLARFYFRQHRYANALDVLDRGIQADGVTDINDVHLIIHKMLVLARMESLDDMRVAGREFVAAVPAEDAEARRWGSSRMESLQRVFEEAQRSDLADLVLEIRQHLDPSERPPVAQPVHVDPALEQRAALLRDPAVAGWIKRHIKVSQLPAEDHRVAAWHLEIAARIQAQGAEMTADWERARSRHPTCLEPIGQAWLPSQASPTPTARMPERKPGANAPHPAAPVRRSRRRSAPSEADDEDDERRPPRRGGKGRRFRTLLAFSLIILAP